MIVPHVKRIMNIPQFFHFCTYSREVIDIYLRLKKADTFNVGFFLDTIKVMSFKVCMIITLLWVYIVIVDVRIFV